MRRWLRIAGIGMISIILLLGLLLSSASLWLPSVIALWLPEQARLTLNGNFGWQQGRITFPALHYWQGDCELATLEGATLGREQGIWLFHASKAALNSPCLNQLPASTDTTPARTLQAWQSLLPAMKIDLDRVEVSPWQSWGGSLQLTSDGGRQTLHYQGEQVTLDAELQGQQLQLKQLTLATGATEEPVTLQGTLQLPSTPDKLPESGALSGRLHVTQVPEPLNFALDWQQQHGTLRVTTASQPTPLLLLPWQASAQQIQVQGGSWQWPWATQPVSGNLGLQVDDWQQGIGQATLSGRFNVLTSGRGGRGNVVVSFGPGKPDWQQSDIPLRITGDSKFADLLFFAALPGTLEGPILDPQLRMGQGALLRMRGRLLSTLEVDEARWPLAGVRVSSAGVSGRLQAILTAHDPTMGDFRLHLDGGARQFWPDKGTWRWRYWGEGHMTPLSARWDVKGRGNWTDTLIELESLSTGFDKLSSGPVTVNAPRLSLSAPVRWQRDVQRPSFSGTVNVDAKETQFNYGGRLPDSHLTLELKGRDPAWFLWRGALTAGEMGPVKVNGRWDGERLRGQAWWPSQSLKVFQSLLSPQMKMRIQSGTLRAQAAFSAAVGQGFEAGGFFAVRDGDASLPDNDLTGVNFSLPYRYKQQQWQLGARRPVALRIASISNQFELKNISADLQGWYPWSAQRPLRLSNVGVELLDGKLSMESLQMPQTDAATLRLKHISMSKLVTAIHPKQIAISGFINGALPLWLNDSAWLVKGGWIANDGPLTMRLDKDMADAIASNNMAAGAAMDWLRYMEISRSWATLDLDNLGWMTVTAQVDGASQFSDRKQRVALHYTHQENLFQLWRSLRFGDNLQAWLQENASLPSQKDLTHDK